MWAVQSGRFTFSRKENTERMIVLCMQLAQKENSAPGRKLGNSGLQEGSEKLQRYRFPCPYILS